jgi:hypothetical protein
VCWHTAVSQERFAGENASSSAHANAPTSDNSNMITNCLRSTKPIARKRPVDPDRPGSGTLGHEK